MTKEMPNHKTWVLLAPHHLDRRVRSCILKKKQYESLADFIRTAVYRQLRNESPIKYPLPEKRQKFWIFYVPPDLENAVNNCTAKTNYSSKSDFVRHAVRNQLEKEMEE